MLNRTKAASKPKRQTRVMDVNDEKKAYRIVSDNSKFSTVRLVRIKIF